MIDKLSKCTLLKIFEYSTPREWIHISEVCRYWKKLIEEIWKKNGTQIVLDSHDAMAAKVRESEPESYPDTPLISMNEAQRIIKQAVPFAEFFSDQRRGYVTGKETLLEIGSYLYKVENDEQINGDFVNHQTLFKLIEQNATKVTKLEVIETPAKELKIIFSSNKITKVVGKNVSLSALHECNATERIEELVIDCSNSIEHLKTFEGNFSNLKRLQLFLTILTPPMVRREEPHCLSQIFSSVDRNIKSLDLTIDKLCDVDLAADYFAHIFNFSQLEEFKLELNATGTIKSMDYFFEKLVSSCPKLRIVKINGIPHGDNAVFKLMELPNLTTLHCRVTSNLCPKEVPENSSILNCHIFHYYSEEVDAIISLFQKMPKLRNIEFTEPDPSYVYFEFAYNLQKAFPTKRIEIRIEFTHVYELKHEVEVMVVKKECQEEAKLSDNEVLNVILHSSFSSLESRVDALVGIEDELNLSSLKDYNAYWLRESKYILKKINEEFDEDSSSNSSSSF